MEMFVILYAIPCKSCELEGTEWFRRSRCTNSFDTEAPLLGLDWSITNGIVSSKIYDKRDVSLGSPIHGSNKKI